MADPYGLFPSYRRLYRKRRNVVKRSAPLARRVRKLESAMEMKSKTLIIGSTPFSTGGLDTLLNGMVIGDDIFNRNGDSILITSIQFDLIIQAQTANDNNTIRILLVQDKQTNGVAQELDKILDTADPQSNIISPYNLDYKHRFRILCDKVITFDDVTNANRHIKIYKKCNIKTRYGLDTTGGVTAIATNSLSLWIFGFSALGDFRVSTRIRFLDG